MAEYYYNLPDYLPVDELKQHFNNLLEALRNQKVTLYDFIESLSELSDRQWHTYEHLEPGLKSRIESVISEIITRKDFNSFDLLIFRNILSSIGNLGLSISYNLLRTVVVQGLSEEKKREVRELVDEVVRFKGGNIENLYPDLKKK